ncbi:MAG: acyl carrier protein [Kiritimatiellae bacterium]|nr:acyl carrier protein [Kiritimatiellia bacterium]
MTDEEIISVTNEVFEESFEIEKSRLTPDANVFNDLGLDSLDTVDLVVGLQKRFGVTIRNDERVRTIRTLQDIYDFIKVVKETEEKTG